VNQQLFISNRNIVVRSKTGYSIAFEKGKLTPVPRLMHEEVMEKGIIPVDDKGVPLDPENHVVVITPPKVVLRPEDKFEADDKILEVIKEIVKRNNPTDFTGGGAPQAAVVTQALGWKVDQKEVRVVWDKNKQELLNPFKTDKE
jgi:hypothetical protein